MLTGAINDISKMSNGSHDNHFKINDNDGKNNYSSEDDTPLSKKCDNIKLKTEKLDHSGDFSESAKIKKEGVKSNKRKLADDSSDDEVPLSAKLLSVEKKRHSESSKEKSVKKEHPDSSPAIQSGKKRDKIKSEPETPTKKPKKEEQEEDVWRWWEEDNKNSGIKWKFLEHKGPVFAPPYERLPQNVKFYYDGKHMVLSEVAEEVAGFYARMLDHDYTSKEVFNKNFFRDWQKVMTEHEKRTIVSLSKCNFNELAEYFKIKSEERKNMSKEEKLKIKEDNLKLVEEYGYCILDGHKQRIGNFRIEPPGLFRGRGDHPKMGMLKKRVMPEDVIINCAKGSKVPEAPKGHKWKEVRFDNAVTWLACWIENVQNNFKYVMLNASSRLKGEKDWKKYETARQLHKYVDKIRSDYRADFKHKEMRVRQRAVALYFIDKLALRAGNEKDDDEADTVGCCSIRYEHIKLHDEQDGKEYVVEFDFLGKDSIRYQNAVPVPKRVYKNLTIFLKNKQEGDDLFDRLNTTVLNQYLRDLMDGLTAKVFRTYNASRTLEEQLELLTNKDDSVAAKVLSYNRANRAVAILCNHQRSVPKTFAKSMENLQKKVDGKREQINEVTQEAKQIKADYKKLKQAVKKVQYEKLKKRLAMLKDQLMKLQMQATDKDENKEIALGTSKLNYLDPRISVAWCKKYDVPLEKVYNKTQREKFRWAIDMATKEYSFRDIESDKSTNKLNEDGDEESGAEEDED